MAYTHEDLALRAREAVKKMLALLERERLVARFVDSYVYAFDRPGLKSSPLRYRELLSTLSREALLIMAAKVNAGLPGKVTRGKKRLLRGAHAEAADSFRVAFFDALAESLRWPAAEREEFRRDLELCIRMSAQLPREMKLSSLDNAAQGPFVDRCALLLDPSLLDKARKMAVQFQGELERHAEKILTEVFRRKRKR